MKFNCYSIFFCSNNKYVDLTDNRDHPPSPVPSSPAPSGLPTNNNVPSTTQSYTNSNNHSISRSASTSTGSFHIETYQTFDWDQYLRETKSTAAPIDCFKQVNVNIL